MRNLAGSAVLAVLLIGSPLGAQEASEQPMATASQAVDMPAKEPALQSPAEPQGPLAIKEAIAVGSDTVAAPPRSPSWRLPLRPRRRSRSC